MGSKGGGMTPVSQTQGFQSSTSTTTPHPEAMAAYQNVLGQASNVAQIPYSPYQGQQVAGFTPDQLAAFQGTRESQGIADPYIQNATGLVNQSLGFADPSRFNASELSRYYNPYQQNVIDATMANMKEMNASQQNQLTGDAIMKGYMGGDRAGIARAELARQQALTNNQTLAGLQQQGYQQAIDQYNKQQQTALGASQTGAYSLGQLGTQAQNAAMQGIQALLGTGGMQQQLGQQQLQSAYDQWQQAMNYPYQQTQWNAGITGAIAPNMGGTTASSGFGQQTQSQPAPSTFNQVAGAGLSALSLLPKIFKDGGRVGYDAGGPILDLVQDSSVPNVWGPNDLDQIARSRWVSADPFDAPSPTMRADGGRMPFGDKGAPWIPAIQLSAARTDYPTPPKVDLSIANAKAPETGLGALSKGIGSMSKEDVQGIKGGLGRLFGDSKPIQLTGATQGSAVGDYVAPTRDELGGLYADGGRIAFAEGGSPYAGWAARGAAAGDAGSSLPFQPRPSVVSQAPSAPPQQQQWSGAGFNPLTLLTGLLTGGGEGGFGNLFSMFAPQQPQAQERTPVGYAPSSLNYNSIDPMTGLYAARSWSPYYMPKYADGGAVRAGFFRGGEPQDDDEIDRYLPALAKGESGGEKDPYSAVGPASRRGDRPYGKYQVMGANIPVWAKEAGLGELTPQQFLADRDAQEAVARHKFREYMTKTGSPQEAAAMWLGGPDYKSHPHARDVLGTDVSKYVDTFNRNLGSGGVGAINNTFRPASDRRGLARVADSGETMNDAAPAPTTPAAEERRGLGSMWSPEVQQGLLAAGLGMMASRSPFPGVAIGEGGLRGMQAYENAVEAARDAAKQRLAQSRLDANQALEAAKFNEDRRWHDLQAKHQQSSEELKSVQYQNRQREAEADRLGLQGRDRTQYIVAGTLPRTNDAPLTATDKRAILEADDRVAQSEVAIDLLSKAKDISKQAYGGIGAGARSVAGVNLPDWMIPDKLASPEKSIATQDLQNLTTQQALESLKAIFGGNPTEGERAILLDIQGSVNKPDEIRQKIYDRGLELARRRHEINKQRAMELRGGEFYKPKDETAPAPVIENVEVVAKPAPVSKYKDGDVAINKATGEKLVFKAGKWTKSP